MGPVKLDSRIMKTMGSWGNNYDSTVGDSHDTCSDKIDQTIDSKSITLNIPSKMDASHAKPSNMNPGVDKAFLAKANPQMDSTGHGRLTRDTHDRM